MPQDILSELECPVCLLPPRKAPVFMCPLGHNICSECKPKLKKCPVCKVNYLKNKETRNFFVEKILNKLERNCRYELFNCDFSACDSEQLVEHEKVCNKKPEVKQNKDEQEEDSEGENIEEIDVGNEFNDPMFLNLVYFYDIRPMFQYYAYTVVFLRMFLCEFSDLNRHPGVLFELSFLVFLCAWLFVRRMKSVAFFMEVYQPDEFETQFQILRKHLRTILFQDANEIFFSLVLWAVFVISCLIYLKVQLVFSGNSELEEVRLDALLFFMKPALTFLTALVCVSWHLHCKWGKLDKWAAVFGVFRLLWLAFNLSYVELTMNPGSLIDDGYCLIFWIQTVTILLPLGKVSFILLELFGFLAMTYNAFDTLFLGGNLEGNDVLIENLQTAFNRDYLKLQFMLQDLKGSIKLLKDSFESVTSLDPIDPETVKQFSKFVEKYKTEL